MSKIVLEQILELIEKAKIVKDINTLDHNKPLSDQGIDSLDFSSLLFSMEELFDIKIPDDDIEKLNNINELCNYVIEKIRQ